LQHQALLRRGHEDAPSACLLHQRVVIEVRVEAEDRQAKAVLPLRLAVTTGRVAAVPVEDRRHIVLEVKAARPGAVAHLDADREGFSGDVNVDQGAAVAQSLNHSGGGDGSHLRIVRTVVGVVGQVDQAVGGLAVDEQRVDGNRAGQLDGGRIDGDVGEDRVGRGQGGGGSGEAEGNEGRVAGG